MLIIFLIVLCIVCEQSSWDILTFMRIDKIELPSGSVPGGCCAMIAKSLEASRDVSLLERVRRTGHLYVQVVAVRQGLVEVFDETGYCFIVY